MTAPRAFSPGPLVIAAMNCSLARSLAIVGERWSLLIAREAIMGTRRFDHFHRRLGIARNILTARLNELVAGGILDRTPSRESARIFDYALTDKGWDLYGVVAALLHWGDRWLDHGKGPPIVLLDPATRKPLPRVTLVNADGSERSPGMVVIGPGPGADKRTRRRLEAPARVQNRGHPPSEADAPKAMVRAVGLEPTRIATADFESAASTVPPRPRRMRPVVSDLAAPSISLARYRPRRES
jgi:DNA-binding HxlR family transcriptional regulator